MNIAPEEMPREIDRLLEEIEEHKNTIATQQQEIERLKELCDKYEEEHKTTFEIWQKDIKENEHLRTALNSKESIIKEAREYVINNYLVEEVFDYVNDKVSVSDEKAHRELLEILDKENK